MLKKDFSVAVIKAPYGLKGENKLHSLSGEWEHLFALAGQEVELVNKGSRSRRFVETVREVIPHVLIQFKGVDSPESARSLVGNEIVLDRSKAAPLAAGEYYQADLIGFSLVFEGKVLGTVESFWDSGAHDLIVVTRADQSKVNVPFLKQFIGEVSIEKASIELLTAWILA